jgi:hypothetical protein
MLVAVSGIVIFPIFISYTLFGIDIKANVVDYFVIIVISSLIDLDHLPTLKKFGSKKYLLAQKRFPSPLHNFFFLCFFSIASAFTLIFISKAIGILIFSIVLHMLWDISEDVFIFRTSYRRWEKTWGLDRKEMEDMYNELLKLDEQITQQEVKKESRIKRVASRLKERLKRKNV